jgi:hypothetical protein
MSAPKIAILIESDFYEHEIWYYHFRFQEAGFEVSGRDNRIIDLEYVVFIDRDIECLRRTR